MPRINNLPKLDFHQVLIEPKRSNLNSRSEVDLLRTLHSEWKHLDWGTHHRSKYVYNWYIRGISNSAKT